MKNIVVTQNVGLTDNQKERLGVLGDVTFFETTPASREEWLERVEGADIIYSEEPQMHESIYDLKNCFLTFPFTGFLQKIDVSILKSNGLIVAGAKGGNKYAVAERNISALLYLTRNFNQISTATQSLSWDFLSSISGVRGLNVLILGKGSIGSVTGEMCHGLGMHVTYYCRGDVLLEKIVGKDVIINCLSFSDETTSLINKQVLNGFSGYYITSVRSQIHNVDDITELLITNAIKGFADDCAGIPGAEVNNPVYQDLKKDLNGYNAFITPHIAWSTSNAIEHSNDVCIENIKQYIQGAPINLLY